MGISYLSPWNAIQLFVWLSLLVAMLIGGSK